MTNKQKVKELSEKYKRRNIFSQKEYSIEHCLLEMAQWKDEQHAKEKQQWIDKLEDWLANNICNAYNFRGDDISSTFMNDCIKAMKGEQL